MRHFLKFWKLIIESGKARDPYCHLELSVCCLEYFVVICQPPFCGYGVAGACANAKCSGAAVQT